MDLLDERIKRASKSRSQIVPAVTLKPAPLSSPTKTDALMELPSLLISTNMCSHLSRDKIQIDSEAHWDEDVVSLPMVLPSQLDNGQRCVFHLLDCGFSEFEIHGYQGCQLVCTSQRFHRNYFGKQI